MTARTGQNLTSIRVYLVQKIPGAKKSKKYFAGNFLYIVTFNVMKVLFKMLWSIFKQVSRLGIK